MYERRPIAKYDRKQAEVRWRRAIDGSCDRAQVQRDRSPPTTLIAIEDADRPHATREAKASDREQPGTRAEPSSIARYSVVLRFRCHGMRDFDDVWS